MPLVPAICTQCGAKIEVDNTHEAGICSYCHTPFITEKAITNYNTTNNISANVVNIYGGNSAEFVIKAGTLVEYNGESSEVVIPDGVTAVAYDVFKGLNVTKLTIPGSITCMGCHHCYDGMILTPYPKYSVKEFVMLDGVSEIGEDAFEYWKNLTTVDIPKSVTKIGKKAFIHCEKLETVRLANGVTDIGEEAFYSCRSLKNIKIPDSVIHIGASAFTDCKSLKNIVLSNNLTSIENRLFWQCRSLTDITIPNSVTSIGENAFSDCSSLTSITIPDSVTSIGRHAFSGCSSLTSITIPDSVVHFGEMVFYNCNSLPNIIASEEWKKTHLKKQGCYIATCVYGSYDCPQVWTLRRFRDDTLDATWYGRAFIKCYYAISPALVKWFGDFKWFKAIWQKGLDALVASLNHKGVEDTKYNDKY